MLRHSGLAMGAWFLLLMGLATEGEEVKSPSLPAASGPRLVVLVVFDQMRADYLVRWQRYFTPEGFGRLLRQGAWFQNCHYPYAATLTAPGHATLSTGCPPCAHGIIANSWYDRQQRVEVGAVRSDDYLPVPALPARRGAGAAPVRRRRPTVGEALQRATHHKGKVVSLSIKDRAAILLAALRASLCFWFSASSGEFVSSSYYGKELPAWVQEFNSRRPAERWLGRRWEPLCPELDYLRLAPTPEVAAAAARLLRGRTFPHRLGATPNASYYTALTLSPFANDLLLELALQALDAERLGQRGVPDLLCLSFSANDTIGHVWGPDSPEVLDVTLRSDRLLARLLAALDQRLGRGRYVLVVTADHGVCPVPELRQASGLPAGRVAPQLLSTQAERFLNDTFHPGQPAAPFIEAVSDHMIYLNRGTLEELHLASEKVETALARWLRQQPGVKAAYPRTQLLHGPRSDDPLEEQVRLSFDPERSGDVVVVLQPYHLLSRPALGGRLGLYGTTHGSPYEYDTQVPLLVYGAGIRPGIHTERVTPLAVAPILARALSVPFPTAQAAVPEELFANTTPPK